MHRFLIFTMLKGRRQAYTFDAKDEEEALAALNRHEPAAKFISITDTGVV